MSAEYGADQIQILEGLEAVRKRPAFLLIPTGIPRPSSTTVMEFPGLIVTKIL